MTSDAITKLRRLTRDPPVAAVAEPAVERVVEERCELCGTPVGELHRHLVEVDERRILCACRPCALLFDPRGAGGGRYRLIPERVLHDPQRRLPGEIWNRLEVPVGIVFVFNQSALGQPVACYPGAAGAAESMLDLSAWAEVVATLPMAGLLEPDVEALLFRRDREDVDAECFLVPIDACYELVGRIRFLWRGFDGGSEVRAAVDEFFAGLRGRARMPAVPA